ncbi:MAG TPA: hypothetical protein VI653_26955, partial [Steroidobacteraceae bacterium]
MSVKKNRLMAAITGIWILAELPATAMAGPDPCNGGNCQGNQSAGINITAPPNTVNVSNLSGPIQPASGTSGVLLQSSAGLNLTVNSGTAGDRVTILTNQAAGITVLSSGAPTPVFDNLLGVLVPSAQSPSGGGGEVSNYGDITTGGAHAPGIFVQSSTTGYSSAVISALQNLSSSLAAGTSGIGFSVTSVSGSGGVVGAPAAGTLLYDVAAPACNTSDPNCKVSRTPISGQTGGAFTVNGNGTFTFDPQSAFDDLALGASRAAAVPIGLQGARSGVNQGGTMQGELVAVVTRTGTDSGGAPIFSTTYAVNFPTLGGYTSVQSTDPAFPNLKNYVDGLISAANGAGGVGGGVIVSHLAGTIHTQGIASYGLDAESGGARGGDGANGGGFFTFGLAPPSQGGNGNQAGTAVVTVNGAIQTDNTNSIGVFAHSGGGGGGKGGDGGTYYSGRLGGAGGDGGLVQIFGSGWINTTLGNAVGIYGLSEGGNGGDGGGGGLFTGGGNAGAGGRGGNVMIDGSWDVTTHGDAAHGIWAKSVGGDAGAGGDGGWISGHAGNGGQATDGGDVTLISGGRVETFGTGAYGLFAQSAGGFGGSGGAGGSIFYSRGGSGSTAGSGGNVSLSNLSGGLVITHGDGSDALFGQSIGGGGGAGGGANAIVGVGGPGGAGGNGGAVQVNNAGEVDTFGDNARGIYAQSVGGGGGDGGNAAGLASIGGRGAGTGADCGDPSNVLVCSPSTGGDVHVTNSGNIYTGQVDGSGKILKGTGSAAIFAQSVGGGGGNGGSATGWFSIGGQGGGGGDAGQVAVENSGQHLRTYGADAAGIYAQSIGGGGGNGGNSVAVGAFTSLSIGG